MKKKIDERSPDAQFSFDVNTSTLFRKDRQNYINVLGVEQLNTLDNVSLLDIYLSNQNVIEPHYHQNAAQLVYCVTGAATVSILNPYTKELHHYPLTPGKVANVPQGWWHYEVATVDDTHLIAIFNAPTPEVILGSDIIKLTPASIIAQTYCVDQQQWERAIKPIQPGTFIGPPKNCQRPPIRQTSEAPERPQYPMPQTYPYPSYNPSPYPAYYWQWGHYK